MTQLQGFPDFFIVGAPRCGTTALSRYLSRNPKICFSRPKETHYFARQSELPSEAEVKRDYIDPYFYHRTADNQCVGEGSVSYLHLEECIEYILQFNPDARFIAMVRNPLTMLPSYHQRMQFLLQEDQADLATAWALEPARRRHEHIPDTCLDYRLLIYGEVVKLGAQIERLFNVAGRDQAHIVVFDDFKADSQAAYRGVLDFLGVEDDGQTEFERRYESQMYRYRWLQRLLFVPATRSKKTMDTLQRRKRKYNEDGSKKRDLIKRITDLNKVPARPAPLSPQMASTIREHVRDDVRLLSDLLQRDLGFWLATEPEETPGQSST